MDLDSTRRFSSRVEDYIRYRPSYPGAIVPLLERECALTPATRIADIGSGTGFFSELFLRIGCVVIGIEPNADMRLAGDRLLAAEPRFRSAEGRAESTGLPSQCVDLVTAGQAFHWFDIPAARSEFQRILTPPRRVVLAWNERLVEGRFLEEYEALLQRYSTDYGQIDHRRMDAGVMDAFYGAGNWRLAVFPNEQLFDLDGVLGRLHSSSYAPPPGSDGYHRINAAIERLFAECRQDGRVAIRYETKVYYGQLA